MDIIRATSFIKGLLGVLPFMESGGNGPQTSSVPTRAESINNNKLSTHPNKFPSVSDRIESYVHPHPDTEESWSDADWRQTDNMCHVNSQYHPYVFEYMTQSMTVKSGHNKQMTRCAECQHYKI